MALSIASRTTRRRAWLDDPYDADNDGPSFDRMISFRQAVSFVPRGADDAACFSDALALGGAFLSVVNGCRRETPATVNGGAARTSSPRSDQRVSITASSSHGHTPPRRIGTGLIGPPQLDALQANRDVLLTAYPAPRRAMVSPHSIYRWTGSRSAACRRLRLHWNLSRRCRDR